MKKIVIFALMFLSLSTAVFATEYQAEKFQYSMEYSGMGRNENILVTITFMCASPSQAESAVKPLAVHGVLFLENAPHPGMSAQTPLVPADAMTKDAEKYFDKFFSGSEYAKYVTSIGTSKMEITKVKKLYQIKVQVAVDKRNLRLELEKQKIIKSLDQIFKNED